MGMDIFGYYRAGALGHTLEPLELGIEFLVRVEMGNRFRLRLHCERSCVRAKLLERDDSAVARVRQIDWGVVHPRGLRRKLRF